jgi:sensor domain CHASE-containing protein
MSEDVRYRRCAGVSETRVDDDLFLVEPASDEVFYLDTNGAALWRLLAEPKSMSEIERVFASAFPDVPAERLRHDLHSILAEMTRRRLVEPG